MPPQRITGLDLAWGIFATSMLFTMWLTPRVMTVPYHFLFVSFALVYGFRMWSQRVSVVILLTITVVTGLIFVEALFAGYVSYDELAEIPLMPAIVAFMVWHGLRRVAAQRRVEELAALESSRLDRQREFLRDTSHAIRTPVTIARGHIELLRMTASDPLARQDADEVLHQLDRLNNLAGRLLAIEQLETTGGLEYEPLDIQTFVAAIGRRWSNAVPRRWIIDDRPAGRVSADEHRLEEALDALIDNALRFTGARDVVRLSSRREGAWSVIEVADSGPGIPPENRARVFERFFHWHPKGEEPGTGLGLALVSAVAGAHGGEAAAGQSSEGGASLAIRLPTSVPQVLPVAVPTPARRRSTA